MSDIEDNLTGSPVLFGDFRHAHDSDGVLGSHHQVPQPVFSDEERIVPDQASSNNNSRFKQKGVNRRHQGSLSSFLVARSKDEDSTAALKNKSHQGNKASTKSAKGKKRLFSQTSTSTSTSSCCSSSNNNNNSEQADEVAPGSFETIDISSDDDIVIFHNQSKKSKEKRKMKSPLKPNQNTNHFPSEGEREDLLADYTTYSSGDDIVIEDLNNIAPSQNNSPHKNKNLRRAEKSLARADISNTDSQGSSTAFEPRPVKKRKLTDVATNNGSNHSRSNVQSARSTNNRSLPPNPPVTLTSRSTAPTEPASGRLSANSRNRHTTSTANSRFSHTNSNDRPVSPFTLARQIDHRSQALAAQHNSSSSNNNEEIDDDIRQVTLSEIFSRYRPHPPNTANSSNRRQQHNHHNHSHSHNHIFGNAAPHNANNTNTILAQLSNNNNGSNQLSDEDLARRLQLEEHLRALQHQQRLRQILLQQEIFALRNAHQGDQLLRELGGEARFVIPPALMLPNPARNASVNPHLALSLMNRDFTEEDYEMLLRLDETVENKKKASTAQVKSITPFKIKEGSNMGQCCVCLCDMETGEMAKTLPCTHSFHERCIDKWLKDYNGVCPICKKSVTENLPEDNSSSKKKSSRHSRKKK